MTIAEILKNIKNKKMSAKEVAEFYLARIEKHNPTLNAFISINEDLIKEASLVDSKKGRLAGVPLGIKDMFCTEGLRTTAGSRMLESFVPPYSATVIEKLKSEGALILGKCNQDEFAMGSTGENSFFGSAKNPWDINRVAGGSSSGSASAVSADLCPASLGTDTGGSVRLPAHFCHLVGIKPSYGRISRYGMISYASSLDQAGTLSHTVEDGALLLDVISGADPKDSTTAHKKATSFFESLESNIRSLKIGIFPKAFSEETMQPEIFKAQKKSIDILKDRGCEIIEEEWPYLEFSVPSYYLISTSEASSNLSRYDGVRYGFRSPRASKNLKDFYQFNRSEGFGDEVKRRILMGAFCLSSGYYDAYFDKACRVRYLIQKGFKNIFSRVDVILCPITNSLPYPLKSKRNSLSTYLNDQFTVSANLAGLPALSLPAGLSKEKLPLGIGLMGAPFEEQKMLNVALALEEDFQVNKERPNGF